MCKKQLFYFSISFFFFFLENMERENEWTLPAITSPELKMAIESFRITVEEDQRHPSFTGVLLSAINCNAIINKINLLSKRAVVVPKNISSQEDYPTERSVHVFKVEVICSEGTLKVNEKVHQEKTVVTCITLHITESKAFLIKICPLIYIVNFSHCHHLSSELPGKF